MVSFDKGPPAALAKHFAALPELPAEAQSKFWYDWGPVFYRGRLTGKVRLLGIASDPGPTERVVGRTLVGDAGQRVQGFLAKLGLTTSYALVNAFPFALHPSQASGALPLLADRDQKRWRNRFYDLVTGPDLQAIVAFGANAQEALRLWDGAPDVLPDQRAAPLEPRRRRPREGLARRDPAAPRSRDPGRRRDARPAQLRRHHRGGRLPRRSRRRDLPFGLPSWVGDDAWGRKATPRHNNSVERLSTDPDHTLVWQAPRADELE